MNDSARPTSRPAIKASARDAVTTATTSLVTTTTDGAREIIRRTAVGIEANPMSALVGGVALGLLAGAVFPRSDRETDVLGPLGKRLTDGAKGALETARETVRSEFDVLGLTRVAARGQASKLLEGVLGAVAAASTAALAGQHQKDEAAKAE